MKSIASVVLAALVVTSCASSSSKGRPVTTSQAFEPQAPREILEIEKLEDRRSLGDGQLSTWALIATDPQIRARALLALGRIQDPTSADHLIKGLTDPDAAARQQAVFALGLLGLSWAPLDESTRTRCVDALKTLEVDESSPEIKLTALEALGRLGGSSAMDRLTDRLSVSGEVQTRAALSMGIAAKAGTALPSRAYAALALLVKKEVSPPGRYAGAYALAQSKNASARTWLLQCIGDDASEIRAICAKGLGDIGTDIDAVALKKLLDDPDYRTAVEATRALAKMANRCKGSSCAAVGALGDIGSRIERLIRGDAAGGGQPLLALAQQGLPMSGRPLLQSLRAELQKGAGQTSDQKTLHDIATIDCRLAAAVDKQIGTVEASLNCGGGLIAESQRLATALHEIASAPAVDGAKRVQEVGSYVFHNDPRVKAAALEALGESKSATAMEKVRTQLASQDLIIAATAASAAAKLGDKTAIPAIRALAQKALTLVDIAPTIADALATLDAKEAIADLEPWLQSTHATIRQSAAEALTRLKNAPVVAPRVERPADTGSLPNLPKDAKLIVRTEKGEFEVKLATHDAQRNSLNLYTLARKGFFRNLTFHRVVPDFVAQGGDPRGDGEGGPGYTIRCEVNRRPYVRGAVGMALSGKDTGGSQFFVTTSPQPHLDGRYTNVGEITKGQEVVDGLLEGDKILDVRAEP